MHMNSNQTLKQHTISRPLIGVLVLVLGAVALVISTIVAISVGAADIDFATVWQAVFHYRPEVKADQVIVGIRLPRELGVVLVGAALAVSGAIVQGITRNPLAEPGLLGINAGAALAITCLLALQTKPSYLLLMLAAFVGAAIGAVLVFGISWMRRGGLSPLKIILAGAAIHALLTAFADGIALIGRLTQELSIWKIGSTSGTTWLQLSLATPVVLVCIAIVILFSKKLTILSFGEEIAKGLGQRTVVVKAVLLVVMLLLSGIAVSLVGALAFVGLMVPHIVRFMVGTDYRWIIPCSAVFGSLLLIVSDTVARLVNAPFETPIGAVVAMIGIPFFLYLARREIKQ